MRQRAAQPLRWDRFDMNPVMLIVIPGGLLAASLLISVLAGYTSSGWSLVLLLALSAVALALQCCWVRAQSLTMPVRSLIFVGHIVVSVWLIWISSFYGIYAFMGYMTALMMFDGLLLWMALFANAIVTAAAQIGGFQQIPNAWFAFLVLAAINTVLVVVFSWVGTRRDIDIAEREAAVRALEEAQRRNSELQEQLLEQAREQGVLEERARLSREIHDTVAQDLVAIVSQLEAIDGDADWAGRVDTAKTLARSGLGEARRAVYALRSPMLDTQPLPLALTELVNAWATVHQLRADVDVDGDPVPTDGDQDLLRICQEALSNVSRHAQATSVGVCLSYVEEGVLVAIKGDGKGFDPAGIREGNGMRGIRERVQASGGTVDITAKPGEGCLVSAVVPT